MDPEHNLFHSKFSNQIPEYYLYCENENKMKKKYIIYALIFSVF